jgi:hypothetical protein
MIGEREMVEVLPEAFRIALLLTGSKLPRLPIQTIADALYTDLQEPRHIEPCGMDRRESVHPAHDVQVRSTSPTGETHGS